MYKIIFQDIQSNTYIQCVQIIHPNMNSSNTLKTYIQYVQDITLQLYLFKDLDTMCTEFIFYLEEMNPVSDGGSPTKYRLLACF